VTLSKDVDISEERDTCFFSEEI